MLTNYSEEKILKSVLEKISDLGYDVSEKSNIRAVIENIIKVDAENFYKKFEIFNSLDFENREGTELDSFLEFFGIKRFRNYNTSNKSFSIFNGGKYDVLIKQNSFIKYAGQDYICYTEQKLNNNNESTIYVQSVNNKVSDKYSYFILGDMQILLDGIEVVGINDFDNKLLYLNQNLSLLKFNEYDDSETDIEYTNRSKSILQSYGDGNLKKIKNYIKGINGVSDVIIEELYEEVDVIIVPDNVTKLDGVIEQATEAVKYFSTSQINLKKPSIMEVDINGLGLQLEEWFKNDNSLDVNMVFTDVKNNLDAYFKEMYFSNNKKISRDTIEFVINKYFIDNKIQFSIDEKKLSVSYAVYSSDDYNSPVVVSELKLRGVKEIVADICIMRGVN